MTSLAATIAAHRKMFDDDARFGNITSRAVPAEVVGIPLGEGEQDVTDSGELGGPSLSPAMNRYLAPPSQLNPYHRSLFYLRHACRNDHPGHTEREEFRGSLCYRVVWNVIAERKSPRETGLRLGLPTESIERLLKGALRWVIEDIDRKQRFDRSRDPRPSEEPTPTRISLLACDAVNRAVESFTVEEAIWNAQVGIMRRRLEEGDESSLYHLVKDPEPHYVKMTRDEWEQRWSWEREWARRQQALWDHQRQCDRCRRAA